ncbi:MAG TPA: hypothetical protein VGB15_04110 [Longimicrobium sp.]|jgi:hypothetical protein
MKKLRLIVDELRVEQFQTLPHVAVSRGTVQGHDDSTSGDDSYISFNNSECRFCLDEPIGPG